MEDVPSNYQSFVDVVVFVVLRVVAVVVVVECGLTSAGHALAMRQPCTNESIQLATIIVVIVAVAVDVVVIAIDHVNSTGRRRRHHRGHREFCGIAVNNVQYQNYATWKASKAIVKDLRHWEEHC